MSTNKPDTILLEGHLHKMKHLNYAAFTSNVTFTDYLFTFLLHPSKAEAKVRILCLSILPTTSIHPGT